MLTIALFGAVFSSFVWLFCAFRFVNSSLSGMSFFDAGIINVLLYTLFVCLPVFLVWAIFGFISQYLHNRATGRQLFKLFAQMKKNQEYSDLLARILLETEQNIKNSFVLSRFDLLIADMNELLSEIILRERLASVEQVEHLWIKVQNGGKWSFGKVLIENYNRQPSFQKKIFGDAAGDNLLAGTILEFCARYQTLLALLEKHDKEKIFLNVIETGVMGKVFTILAPVSDEIRRSREVFASTEPTNLSQEASKTDLRAAVLPQAKKAEVAKKGFFSRFMPSKSTVQNVEKPQKDAFSLALERSFGDDLPQEPVFEIAAPKDEAMPAPAVLEPEPECEVSEEVAEPQTELEAQKTLDNLKKQWQDFDKDAGETSDDELAYPFGGWTDAGNYQK